MIYIGQLEFCVCECGSIASPPTCTSQMWCAQCYSCVICGYSLLRKRRWHLSGKSRKFQCHHSNPLLVPSPYTKPREDGHWSQAARTALWEVLQSGPGIYFNPIWPELCGIWHGRKILGFIRVFYKDMLYCAETESEQEFLSLLLANESSKGCVWQQKRFL